MRYSRRRHRVLCELGEIDWTLHRMSIVPKRDRDNIYWHFAFYVSQISFPVFSTRAVSSGVIQTVRTAIDFRITSVWYYAWLSDRFHRFHRRYTIFLNPTGNDRVQYGFGNKTKNSIYPWKTFGSNGVWMFVSGKKRFCGFIGTIILVITALLAGRA